MSKEYMNYLHEQFVDNVLKIIRISPSGAN